MVDDETDDDDDDDDETVAETVDALECCMMEEVDRDTSPVMVLHQRMLADFH